MAAGLGAANSRDNQEVCWKAVKLGTGGQRGVCLFRTGGSHSRARIPARLFGNSWGVKGRAVTGQASFLPGF